MRHRVFGMMGFLWIWSGGRPPFAFLLCTLQGLLGFAAPPVQAAAWHFPRSTHVKPVDPGRSEPGLKLSWEAYMKRLNQPRTHWLTDDSPIDDADIELERRTDEALAVEARNGGSATSRIAMLLSFHARALVGQRKWRESLEDFEHADALLKDVVPDSERLRALIAYPAAMALQQLDRGPEAIRILQSSLESLRAWVPAANNLYASSMELLGNLYCEERAYRTGLALLLKAQAMGRELAEPSSLSFTDYFVAKAYFYTGRIRDAEVNNAEALHLVGQASSGGLNVARLLAQRGQILLELQRNPEAQQEFQNALNLYQTMVGHHLQDIQGCRAGLAVALLAQDRVEEARGMAEDIMAIYEREQWHEDWELSDVAYVLGASAQQSRDFKAARLHLFQSWHIRSLLMAADALTVTRGLELSELLKVEHDWDYRREYIFEWLYPQLGSVTDAPTLSKLQVTAEWAAILHATHRIAEEIGVREGLSQQCAQALADHDSAAEAYCHALKPFRLAATRQ